ncbi:MAG: type II secretion system F family protein [Granulosicoccus sp.]
MKTTNVVPKRSLAELNSFVPLHCEVRSHRRLNRKVKCSSAALAAMLFHLGHLLQAGVPILDALEELASLETRSQLSRLWLDIRRRVDRGECLSEAISVWPGVFDSTSVALMRAGEASGQLPATLAQLEEQLRWQHGVAARLQNVLIYPVFAASVLMAACLFLFAVVMPSLTRFLLASGEQLSWHARLLSGLSESIIRHADVALPLLLLVVVTIAVGYQRSTVGRYLLDAALLRVHIIGQLLAQLSTARYARTLGLLLDNGVSLVDGMFISEAVVANRALRLQLSDAREALLRGQGLSEALHGCPSLPSTLRRLVAAGESTGALDKALLQGANQLQSSSACTIDRIEKLAGPVLLCAIGGLLLWMVVSVLLPVYDAASQVGVL